MDFIALMQSLVNICTGLCVVISIVYLRVWVCVEIYAEKCIKRMDERRAFGVRASSAFQMTLTVYALKRALNL